jgi:benzoyl-CoA reductase/2-hydroxyglutaryl-CoA dehydratase subunit BcrC/BadD/HgdB
MMLLKFIPLKKLVKLAKIGPLRRLITNNLLAFTGIESYKILLDIYVKHIANTERKDARVVWVPFIFPNEILTAFDVEPYTPESAALTFLDFFGADQTFDAAASLALSDDICSIQRSLYGCSQMGIFPKPTFHIRGSFCSCDNQRISIDAMDSVRDVPSFFIDTPISGRPHAKKYLKEEFKALIDFCEELFDMKFDKNRFAKDIDTYRQAWELLDAVMELRAGDCFPFRQDALNNAYTLHFTCVGGAEGALRFASALYEEVCLAIEKAQAQGNTRPEDEIRVLWQGLTPKPEHADIMNESKIRYVYDELFHIIGRLPPNHSPLDALVEKYTQAGCLFDIEKRIEQNLALAERLNIDGAIFANQWGCRQNNAAGQPMKEAFQKEGYPLLILDFDMADSRNFFEEQTRTRFAAFAEIIRGY